MGEPVSVVFFIFSLLWCAAGNFHIPFAAVHSVSLLLSGVSWFKYAARGEQLFLSDFAYISQIAGVTGSGNISITAYIVFSFISGAVLFGALLKRRFESPSVNRRAVCLGVSALCAAFALNFGGAEPADNASFTASFFGNPLDAGRVESDFEVMAAIIVERNAGEAEEETPPEVNTARTNLGADEPLSEVSTTQSALGADEPSAEPSATPSAEPSAIPTEEPPAEPPAEPQIGYNEAYLLARLKDVTDGIPADIQYAETKPNVIVILSESFWDIGTVDGIELSEEPIPNFKRLAEESVTGEMISVTFGGGTADVEFELLTGYLNRFIETDLTAYESFLDKPVMSAASVFKRLGYRTVALHTYTKEFYNRVNAFKHLGFDEFIASEDLTDPVYFGDYIADSVINDMIIEQYENKNGPLFAFAITMQNHQPFPKERYPEPSIRVLNEDIPQALRESVEVYLHGVNESDRELQRLVDYFSAQNEPTVILFFGDHQPTLGANFELYRYTGEITDTRNRTPEQFRKLLATPFFIWSNYKEETARFENIGANFLISYLFDYIEQPKPVFYHFLDRLYNAGHFLGRRELYINDDENILPEAPPEDFELVYLYDMFQYDMLTGEGYAVGELEGFPE